MIRIFLSSWYGAYTLGAFLGGLFILCLLKGW